MSDTVATVHLTAMDLRMCDTLNLSVPLSTHIRQCAERDVRLPGVHPGPFERVSAKQAARRLSVRVGRATVAGAHQRAPGVPLGTYLRGVACASTRAHSDLSNSNPTSRSTPMATRLPRPAKASPVTSAPRQPTRPPRKPPKQPPATYQILPPHHRTMAELVDFLKFLAGGGRPPHQTYFYGGLDDLTDARLDLALQSMRVGETRWFFMGLEPVHHSSTLLSEQVAEHCFEELTGTVDTMLAPYRFTFELSTWEAGGATVSVAGQPAIVLLIETARVR